MTGLARSGDTVNALLRTVHVTDAANGNAANVTERRRLPGVLPRRSSVVLMMMYPLPTRGSRYNDAAIKMMTTPAPGWRTLSQGLATGASSQGAHRGSSTT